MSPLVVDASAIVAALVYSRTVPALDGAELHAPSLIDFEVAHVLRGLALRPDYGESRARDALSDFLALELERHAGTDLLLGIWRHRHEISAYDAGYVALSQALGAPLATGDRRLARAADRWCEVVAVD